MLISTINSMMNTTVNTIRNCNKAQYKKSLENLTLQSKETSQLDLLSHTISDTDEYFRSCDGTWIISEKYTLFWIKNCDPTNHLHGMFKLFNRHQTLLETLHGNGQ